MLAIACAYQLSFSFVTSHVEKKAAEYAQGDYDKEFAYLDSMKAETVYNLGLIKFNYAECLEREINLGLDLRGGMNVTMEIAVEDVIRSLSEESTEPEFLKSLADAREAQKSSTEDYITLFAEAWANNAGGNRLASIFATLELKDKVKPDMTDQEVIRVLRQECESAIDNSFNVLSNRIDRFGVVQPNIQRLENRTGRILIELPGVKDAERVRKLLQGTANLEFWTTYTAPETYQYLVKADNLMATLIAAEAPAQEETPVAEETGAEVAADSSIVSKAAAEESSVVENAANVSRNPLLAYLQLVNEPSPVVGYCRAADTSKVNTVLNNPQVSQLFPRDMKFMWSVKPASATNANVFELYAMKTTADGKAVLDGSAVSDASGNYQQNNSTAEVTMSMNADGAKAWANITRDNKGNYIAITLDDYVYSAPVVRSEITGGNSSITGNFTITEAKDLANVLKSGKLRAPARIVQESVVGPSLGQESINAGMTSFVIAFVLVLIYMILFYNTAGFVASVALVCNLFFLFGVLVSFGAVLTLPGIAGIVLTMGMAVDANVIIYERVKEELRSGKGLSLSLREGYSNAYSAIIDGNVTTLITGIVLFIFGSGPVQGFATTLIIGILTSLFCAIFITRLVFEARLDKGRSILFSNKKTENFLTGLKINFIGLRKYSYVVSASLIIIGIISLCTLGLNKGVDFSGGRTFVVRFDKTITANEVRDALRESFAVEADRKDNSFEVKQYGTVEQKQMKITTQYRYSDDGEEVTREIDSMLYASLSPLYENKLSLEEFTTTAKNPLGIVSAEKVGASIAHDITVNAFWAVLFSLFAIFIYIAFRFKNWQYGLGGVAGLVHDSFLTIGLFSLLYPVMPFDLTIDQSFIAAILTIVGYSINDTVVIFDRIRENITLYPKRNILDNMNAAINSTMPRTINTSGTTLVVLLAIFIFGGEVIRGFVFALMFGVIIGTFSSIFVASPVAYDCLRKFWKKKGTK